MTTTTDRRAQVTRLRLCMPYFERLVKREHLAGKDTVRLLEYACAEADIHSRELVTPKDIDHALIIVKRTDHSITEEES